MAGLLVKTPYKSIGTQCIVLGLLLLVLLFSCRSEDSKVVVSRGGGRSVIYQLTALLENVKPSVVSESFWNQSNFEAL